MDDPGQVTRKAQCVCSQGHGKPESARDGVIDDFLCLGQNALQFFGIAEALRVNFVDFLGAGRARGKPAAGRHHLDAADRCTVARCMAQYLFDLLAGQPLDLQLVRRQLGEPGLLCRRGRRLRR